MKFDNDIPIYLQIVNEIKLYIISGKLKPGDRLLSVREFAVKFKVNPNTIQKALQELTKIFNIDDVDIQNESLEDIIRGIYEED